MKKLSMILPVVALLCATACSDDSKMVTYNAKSNEAFFEKTSYSMSSDSDETCSVCVYRASGKGAVAVPLTVEFSDPDKASLFTVPSEVCFEDGEVEALLDIDVLLSNFEFGETVSLSLTLGGFQTPLPYVTSCVLNAQRDYSYKVYAHGYYESEMLESLFGEEELYWELDLLVAEQNPNYFRLKDFYYAFEGGRNYSEEGWNLDFLWDGESNEFEIVADLDGYGCATIPSGFYHPSYGMCYMYVDTDPEYTYYDSDMFLLNYQTHVAAGPLIDWGYDCYMIEEVVEE